jgi:hypothetical protein
MTYGVNAKVLEIISGQTGQQFGGDVILSGCRLVAFEPSDRSQSAMSINAPCPAGPLSRMTRSALTCLGRSARG